MPVAEIITIGTEILLGEIVDTNARYIARTLRSVGIDLYHKTTVGDNADRIAQAIHDATMRSDVIITSGGLGPTVDDPTRKAIAMATGKELEYHPELWDQIVNRFQRFGRKPTENNRRQAFIPQGALAVENPVGTAPAFIVETQHDVIIALPGVPREMEHLMEHTVIPYLRERFALGSVIKARLLHTAGVGESQIDDLIADLETLANPSVGLAAHSGQVDVRITAKADSESQADEMIAQVEEVLRRRLGDWVYGVDEQTLEDIALEAIGRRGWELIVVEAGLGGFLVQRLASADGPFLAGEVLKHSANPAELRNIVTTYSQERQAAVGLGVTLQPAADKQEVYLVLVTPDGVQEFNRPYGGPPANAPRWALHHSLNILRAL